jgi:drug/metabolite transporter (DMT)-like permease
MIAVAGGLGAAVCWATALLIVSRATKLADPTSVLAGVMLTGFVVVVPIALSQGMPEGLGSAELRWLVIAGAGSLAGLLLTYTAVRIGMVSIVAPISSTQGAIAASIAVIAGETISPGVGAMLGLIVVGVVLVGITENGGSGDPLRATLLAVGAAVSFGVSLYATGRVSDALPLVWAILPARVIGVALITLPLIALGRLHIPRPVRPLVVLAGLLEIVGFTSFALGSRHGIAIAAVLASQFAAIATVAAYFLFRERLTPLQVGGVVAIVTGVAAVTVLQI